jgi:hypothetical protein
MAGHAVPFPEAVGFTLPSARKGPRPRTFAPPVLRRIYDEELTLPANALA